MMEKRISPAAASIPPDKQTLLFLPGITDEEVGHSEKWSVKISHLETWPDLVLTKQLRGRQGPSQSQITT